MAKFIKPFKGVPKGEIYPKQYQVGDECPTELEDGARSLKALEKASSKTAAAAVDGQASDTDAAAGASDGDAAAGSK